MGLAVVSGAPAAGAAPAGPTVAVPAVTGPFTPGREILHLVDRGRPDPWVAGHFRELMVSVYYPARRGTGIPARYAGTAETRALLDFQGLSAVIPPEVLSEATTNARVGAVPVPGRHPLVLLSPGSTAPRYTLTALAEDLASRGYVVAAIDHAYEAAGAAFPSGVLPCPACDPDADPDGVRTTTGRAADVSFVLDQLLGRFARMIDPRRVGMAGHSLGGASAVPAMAADPRIRAGADLDGGLHPQVPPTGLDGRPFLLLGNQDHVPGGADPSWDVAWQRLDGPRLWLTVTGAGHLDFSDFAFIAAELGLPTGGPLAGERTIAITRAYLAAFFDQYLKHRPQPILTGPSARFPEVVYQRP